MNDMDIMDQLLFSIINCCFQPKGPTKCSWTVC